MGQDDFRSEVEIEKMAQKREEEQLKNLLDKAIDPYLNHIRRSVQGLRGAIEENRIEIQKLEKDLYARQVTKEVLEKLLIINEEFLEGKK